MDRSALDSAFFDTFIVMNRKLRTFYDGLVREQGLTLSRARLLNTLASSGQGMTQTELAASLEIEQPSAVSLIDGLQKMGLVVRVAVETDRRAKRVELTPAGREMTTVLKGFTQELRQEMLSDCSPEELTAATRVMENMLARILEMSDARKTAEAAE